MEEKSTKNYKGIATFLAILCLGLIIVIFYLSSRISGLRENISNNYKVISDQESEIQIQQARIEGLIVQYETIKTQRDSLGLNSIELEKKIVGLNRYLSSVKKKSKISSGELARYKELLSEYEEDIALRDEQLIQLKAAYDTLQSTTELQKVEMQMMTKYMVDLENKIEIASVLKVENLIINAINSKGKEYDGGEYKQKRVEKVKVQYTLSDNKVVEKGNKEVFMRLIEPSGSVLSSGGTFVADNGKTLPHTQRQVLNFDNTLQEMQFIYSKGTDYSKGTYKVELFIDGHMVGKSKFVIK